MSHPSSSSTIDFFLFLGNSSILQDLRGRYRKLSYFTSYGLENPAADRSVFTFKKIEKSVIAYILLNLLIQGKLCYNLIVLKYKTFCSRLYCCYSKKIGHRPNFKMFSPTAPRFFLPRFFNLLVIAFILANCMYIYSFLKLYIYLFPGFVCCY